MVELFAYYAGGFDYGGSVVSIRSEGGIVSKEEKGWGSEVSSFSLFEFGGRELGRELMNFGGTLSTLSMNRKLLLGIYINCVSRLVWVFHYFSRKEEQRMMVFSCVGPISVEL